MNNEKNKSSSQMSTTHFNNRSNNSSDRLNEIRNNPHGRNFYGQNNVNNNVPQHNLNLENHENLDDNERKNNTQYLNKIQSKQSDNKNNEVNNSNYNHKSSQNGRSGIADNLRDRLNTMPSNMKNATNDATKKGAEALKKSANPYAKAAGYALSAIQKKKEKKEKAEEEKEEEEKNEETEEETTDSEVAEEKRGQALLKKLLPIIMLIAPIILIILLMFTVLSPVVTAYSWFTSLFHHKTDEASSYTIYNEQDEKNRKAEEDYNNAILGSKDGSVKGIIQEYQEKYGVTIDWYLLNALITYRYTADNDDLYSSSGSEDISDEELEERLKALENGEATSDNGNADNSNTSSSVDYTDAKKKIKAFASLMVVKSGDSYITDKEKGGVVYNNVLSSTTFKSYYKKMFADDSEESRKQILDYIYDYAEGAREFLEGSTGPTSGGVVGDTSIIHLQTCKQSYATKSVNGITVYDNPSWSEGTEYPDFLDAKDYLKGVLSREIGVSNDYKEAMKAQAIAALTYLINDSKSGFNLKSGEMYFPSGTCRQATCSPIYGCTSVVEATATNLHTFYAGQNRFSGGQNHGPINETDNAILEEVLNAVFGKIMVKKGVTSASFSGSSDAIHAGYLDSCNPGTCFSQQGAISDAKGGMTYEQILGKYYSGYEYDIIDIKEGLYVETGGSYTGGSLNESYHYHQGDSEWKNLTLCGSGPIGPNGCNITSAAMAISIAKNQRITPATLQSRQGSISSCGPGTRPQMIINFAKLYGLSAIEIKKDNQSEINNMLAKIATGHYAAVARIAPNSGIYSTSNGHYVTVVSTKTEGGTTKVLVWDPGSHSSLRDNAWIDINYLVKYLQSSYSFILIGS